MIQQFGLTEYVNVKASRWGKLASDYVTQTKTSPSSSYFKCAIQQYVEELVSSPAQTAELDTAVTSLTLYRIVVYHSSTGDVFFVISIVNCYNR
jgi:hypothetical protein